MEEFLQIFLQNTYSIQQIRVRFNLLKTYLLTNIFNSTGPSAQITDKEQAWIESLGIENLKAFTTLNINEKLEQLDQQLKKLQPITIYIPFDLPEEEVNNLGKWVRTNFGSSTIIEIKFDGNLIGGSAISWKGNYRDFSLRAMLEQSQTEIIQNLKKHLT